MNFFARWLARIAEDLRSAAAAGPPPTRHTLSMHCRLHDSRRAVAHAGRSSARVALRPVISPSKSRTVPAAHKWQVFGPSSEYSDGDAEYFRVTNQLADQYEWFAPGRQQEEQAAAEEQQEDKPLYGLTPQQIAALGLSGPGINTPDPVSWPASDVA